MFSRSLFLASWFFNCHLHGFMYLYLWLHYFLNRQFSYRREDSFTVLMWSPLSTKDRFQWLINSTKFPPVVSSTLQRNKICYTTFYSTMLYKVVTLLSFYHYCGTNANSSVWKEPMSGVCSLKMRACLMSAWYKSLASQLLLKESGDRNPWAQDSTVGRVVQACGHSTLTSHTSSWQ
jgi:hypothetical protein